MLIRKLIYILFFVASNTIFAQTTLSIGANEELSIGNGGILTINNIRFEPTATVSFSNTSISEATSTGNTAAITNINKVLVASSPINNYTGNITVKYTAAQLNGLSPTDLKVSFFDLIWNPSATSSVNTTAKTVRSSFSDITFNEITLQVSTTTSTESTTTTTSTTSDENDGDTAADDPDSDGDGVLDSVDDFPNDPDEWEDSDDDGIGNNEDQDDDQDGYPDQDEIACGSDPLNGSNIPLDTDQDLLANCVDPDDDNDDYLDEEDAFPLDPSEWIDTDDDGIGNNEDQDDDQDGYPDQDEIACGSDPLNGSNTPLDTDQDLLANCVDPDDDNDDYLDEEDAFPLDPSEWIDTDGDGIGNNEDRDDDNDCYSDSTELTYQSNPLDSSSIPEDQDLDCIPDDEDEDDNNDGYPDDKILVGTFFTPNSDGINDYFNILNIKNFSNNHVAIFTRTGIEVLSERNYQNNWSGTYNGMPLPEGSYYYRIDIDGNGSVDFEGWLYLTR